MKEHKPEEMILLLSDLQPGVRTPTFNTRVFEEEIDRLTEGVLRLWEIHSADREISKLYVAAAGDFIEGEPYTHRINISEMDARNGQVVDTLAQKRLVVNLCELMLKRFADVFSEVTFVGVYGNHGATRTRDASTRSNDDIEVYYSLSDRLRGNHHLRFEIDPSRFYQVFTVAGHPFLLAHGHQIRMWSRTPLYGIINMVTLWHQVIPEKFEYGLLGHFHSMNYIDAVGTPVYVNGAFCDDGNWGMSKGLKSTAAQWVIGVHPTRGTTWERRVWLK